jgi:hypothetical protein
MVQFVEIVLGCCCVINLDLFGSAWWCRFVMERTSSLKNANHIVSCGLINNTTIISWIKIWGCWQSLPLCAFVLREGGYKHVYSILGERCGTKIWSSNENWRFLGQRGLSGWGWTWVEMAASRSRNTKKRNKSVLLDLEKQHCLFSVQATPTRPIYEIGDHYGSVRTATSGSGSPARTRRAPMASGGGGGYAWALAAGLNAALAAISAKFFAPTVPNQPPHPSLRSEVCLALPASLQPILIAPMVRSCTW